MDSLEPTKDGGAETSLSGHGTTTQRLQVQKCPDGLNYYVNSMAFTLNKLNKVFDKGNKMDTTRVAAYECLAELSKIMRVLLERYSLGNHSKELLLDSRALISHVKQFNYDTYSAECHANVLAAINKLHCSFRSCISNYVMATDMSTMGVPTSLSSSGPNMVSSSESNKLSTVVVSTSASSSNGGGGSSDGGGGSVGGSSSTAKPKPTLPTSIRLDAPEERLLAHPEGMNIALEQAKFWSKYSKDLITYLEKRTQAEIDYHRTIVKISQSLKGSLIDESRPQSYLPLEQVYINFATQEIENGSTSLTNFDLLSTYFLVPLNEHRLEFEKKMKKIKECWARERKAMNDIQSNFHKYRDLYHSKEQELQKIKIALKQSESFEWTNHDKTEKKRRTSEEAVNDAIDLLNKAVVALHSQTAHMNKIKRDLIIKIQDLLTILEMKIKEITTHYFETLNSSMTYSPGQIKSFIDDTDRYECGKSYRDFVSALPMISDPRQHSSGGAGAGVINSFKLELESSESDTNLPFAPTAELHHHHHHAHHHHSAMHSDKPSVSTSTSTGHNQVIIDFEKDHDMNALTKHLTFKSSMDNFDGEMTNDYLANNGQHGVDKKKQTSQHQQQQQQQQQKQRLFGIPLTTLSTDSVPNIVRQCVEEIELRGAHINGIYRVSGVKSKVENLCASYENNPANVDLSNLSPNVIANVLKHFLRELPEPLMTFQLYSDFIQVAQKYASTHSSVENSEDIVANLKKVVCRMPLVHYNTLKYLMHHLRRISHNCAVNNMPPSNLGIIFGPTLLRRNNEANVSNSTLFDASHQSRVVELLIIYANEVFGSTSDEVEEGVKGGDTLEIVSLHSSTSPLAHHKRLQQSSAEKQQQLSNSKSSLQSESGTSYRQLYKSATCSSIMAPGQPINNQSKQNIVEARRQFFTSSAFNSHQQGGPFYKYKPYLVSSSLGVGGNTGGNVNTGSGINNASTIDNFSVDNSNLSPFSQIAASSASVSSTTTQGYKIKRLTSANSMYVNSGQQPQLQQQQQSHTSSQQELQQLGMAGGGGGGGRIYAKNNELSKSSSSLYSMKNSLLLLTSNEDHV